MRKLLDKIYSTLCSNKKTVLLLGIFLFVFLVDGAFADDHDDYIEHCFSENIDKAQNGESDCWSCDIILAMMTASMMVIKALYDPIQDLCEIIIQFGGAIWLALYFLKSLGSFAAQDPKKVMDGAMIFMFKWALVYALIMAGIGDIVGYIVNPILSIGFDIGEEFSKAASSTSGIQPITANTGT